MIIRDEHGTVEVRCVELQPPTSPRAGDLKLWVRVAGRRFTAESDEVWMEATTYRHFIEQLRELVTRRSGWAELRSVSQDGLHLHFRPVGRSGAVDLTVRFGVTDIGRSSFEVEFGVGLFRDALPEIVTGFERVSDDPAEPVAAPAPPKAAGS